MAAQGYTNDYSSTLGSGYTSGGTTLTVASASGLPASGLIFYLKIESEYFKVTSYSGTTLTVVGAQQGSSAANHSSGVAITGCWWLPAVVDGIRSDQSQVLVYSSLPVAGMKSGDVAYTSDALNKFVYDGSIWRLAGNCTLASNAAPCGIEGLQLWCSGDTITGLVDGNTVDPWPNLVTSGIRLQGLGTPTYKTGIVNSLPVVRFAGSDYLQGIMPQLVGASSLSAFIVAKFSALSNAYTGLFAAPSGSFLWAIKSNGTSAFYNGGTNYDGSGSVTVSTGTFYVFTLIIGLAGISTRIGLSADFTSASTAFRTNSAGTKGTIAADLSTGGRIMSGDIAEICVYDRQLSTTDRNTVEGYLKTKYGL